MFKSAIVRLTLGYLAIIMFLSFLFSFVVYRISFKGIEDGLQRQRVLILNLPRFDGLRNPGYLDDLVQAQIANERTHLLLNLLLANLSVLVVGGGASYGLARRNLEPIEAALEAQTRFASDASHELRTPLTAMKSEVEVALRDKDMTTAEARDILHSTLEEVDKLENLASGLLKLAQRRGEPDFDLLQLRDVIDEAANRLAKAASQRHIGINISVPKDLTIVGSHANLVELLVVLLDNAIKYSPDKSGVELVARAETTQRVRIEVSDQGVGIPATAVPHIFDRFYRADASRNKREVAGYGLGLAIAQEIVTQHHATIAVKSEPNHGTTMIVRLPTHRPTTPTSIWHRLWS